MISCNYTRFYEYYRTITHDYAIFFDQAHILEYVICDIELDSYLRR